MFSLHFFEMHHKATIPLSQVTWTTSYCPAYSAAHSVHTSKFEYLFVFVSPYLISVSVQFNHTQYVNKIKARPPTETSTMLMLHLWFNPLHHHTECYLIWGDQIIATLTTLSGTPWHLLINANIPLDNHEVMCESMQTWCTFGCSNTVKCVKLGCAGAVISTLPFSVLVGATGNTHAAQTREKDRMRFIKQCFEITTSFWK